MLKRMAVLSIVGAFLAAPPAIAKSSATVQAPAPADAKTHDGPCPFDTASSDL